MAMTYVIYDMKDNERLVFTGNKQETMRFLDKGPKVLDCVVCRKSLANNRYLVERIKIDEEEN